METISQSRANDTIFRIFIALLLLGGHPRGYRSRKSRDSLTQRQRIAKMRFPAGMISRCCVSIARPTAKIIASKKTKGLRYHRSKISDIRPRLLRTSAREWEIAVESKSFHARKLYKGYTFRYCRRRLSSNFFQLFEFESNFYSTTRIVCLCT